jgi:SAM-dependent methyltransferase
MERAEYWNRQYLEYWQKRVGEANSGQLSSTINAGDRPTVSDGIIVEQLDLMEICNTHAVLDLGCGYGRLFPILLKRTANLCGTDISSAMIAEAQNRYGSKVRQLRVEEAESSSFPDQSFDRVICWAVFDATEQVAVVTEILRILRSGGLALISGKSHNYCDDDELALVAEENARRKGHPNYFTDYPAFVNALTRAGGECLSQRFYLRRGDLPLNHFTVERPARFYEFVVILTKLKQIDKPSISSFSDSFSLTWRRMRGAHMPEGIRTVNRGC